jgi:hypothetical protein
MTQAKNVGKATTATAKPKSARVRATKSEVKLDKDPIGWHFVGKEIRPMQSGVILSKSNWDMLIKMTENRQIRKWRVAFWIAFAGFIIMAAMNIFK